jgi:hypothetical protein
MEWPIGSMNPVSTITCTTCRARLRVRSAAAWGEILPCPKCGGMVLVAAPTADGGSSARPTPGAGEVASPGVIGSSFDQVDELLDEPSQQPDTEVAVGGSMDADRGVSPSQESPLPLDLGSMSGPLLWARRLLLLAVASLAGVSLAVVVVALLGDNLWPRSSQPGPSAVRAEGQSTAVPAPASQSRHAGGPATEDMPAPADSQSKVDPTRAEATSDPSGRQDAPVLAMPALAEAARRPPDSDRESSRQPGQPRIAMRVPPEAAGEGVGESREQPEPTDPRRPAGQDAADADLSASPPGFQARSPEVPRIPVTTGLASLANLLEDRPVMAAAVQEPVDTELPDTIDEAPEGQDRDRSAGASTPVLTTVSVDVAARLQDQLQAAHFSQVPLVDFLRGAAQLSTIPISVDPEGLAYANVTAETPVSIEAGGVCVADLLRDALAPLRLTCQRRDLGLVVTSAALTQDEMRAVTFPVADLCQPDRGEAERLGRWVRQLLEPSSWEGQGGSGQLRVRAGEGLQVYHRRSTHYRILVFLERLRLARGLELQSRLGPDRVPRQPRWVAVAPRLQRPVTTHLWHPEPLGSILAELERAGGVRFLVDWVALAGAGVTTETPATLAVRGEPLQDALESVLQPWGLTFYPQDGRNLRVTTAEQARQSPYVELYSRDALHPPAVARLQEMTQAAGAAAPIQDAVSQTILVSLPPHLHRQLSSGP